MFVPPLLNFFVYCIKVCGIIMVPEIGKYGKEIERRNNVYT